MSGRNEASVADAPETNGSGVIDENIAALLDSLGAVTKERDDAREQMLRAMADLQNFRRRSQEQIDQLRKVATEQLVRKLLPVLDNFERTIAALEGGASVASVLEGVKGIDQQLRGALESVQVARIDAVGQPFDHDVHEAVATHDDPELPANTVVDEIEPGYTMGGQVIRPARVRVSKQP